MTTRAEALRLGHEKCSLPDLMALYSDDITYSDYFFNMLNMDSATLSTFFTGAWDPCGDVKVTTRGHYGNTDISVWEWTFDIEVVKTSPLMDVQVGQRLKFVGCSIIWWNKEGKIYKQADYPTIS